MTIQRLYATLALAAAALLVAGCGGGNGMGGGATSTPATSAVTKSEKPGETGGGGGLSATSVDLPADHGIAEAGEHTVLAGATLKVAGARFSCAGEVDCVVTVAVDSNGVASATYSGGEPTAAALDATGNQAFENLSAALLDTGGTDSVNKLENLKARLYHDVMDVDADESQWRRPADVDESVDNGGGVTTSLTTHEDPSAIGADDPLTGVSDIFVSVDGGGGAWTSTNHATAVVQWPWQTQVVTPANEDEM